MKIAVVGSREYPNLGDVVKYILSLPKDVTIISGGARGVDTVAEETAKAYGLQLEIYPAEWVKYGNSAGYIRNKKMVDVADVVVAFWDGVSKGTKHSIDLAQATSTPCVVFLPNADMQRYYGVSDELKDALFARR